MKYICLEVSRGTRGPDIFDWHEAEGEDPQDAMKNFFISLLAHPLAAEEPDPMYWWVGKDRERVDYDGTFAKVASFDGGEVILVLAKSKNDCRIAYVVYQEEVE